MSDEKYCFNVSKEGQQGLDILVIKQGHTETEWDEHCEKMQKLVEDDSAIIAFYQSNQVSGVKSE